MKINNFLKLFLLLGLFLMAREASANCMWDTHGACKDIGATWVDAGSGHDSYCDGTFKDPKYTNHCCCGSDIVGCCKKNLSGKITTENLLGQTCKSLTGYYSTTFYQDKTAENNQCNDKPNCHWADVLNDNEGNAVSEPGTGCQDSEKVGNDSSCAQPKPRDEANKHSICCCATPASTNTSINTSATLPKFVIPDLQIKIPGLNFSSNNCVDNGDKTYACSIPWIGEYINAIYSYGISIAGILAAILLMAGGMLWLISGGDTSKIIQARELIGGSIIGIIILMSSYLILKQINPALLQSASITFNTINETDLEPVSNEGNPNNSDKCEDCVNLDSRIPYKNHNKLKASLNDKLKKARDLSGNLGWRVTEAYPPSSTHKSKCHYNGACVDIGLTGDKNCNNVKKLISIFEQANLKILNEYLSCNGTKTTYTTGGHLHVQ